MKATKKEIVEDLKFCGILADKLVKLAEEDILEMPYNLYGHSRVKNDIIRLRRELNEVNKKLGG